MKLSFIMVLVCSSVLEINTVSAQETTPQPAQINIADLFFWATTTPPDWSQGALLAGLGFVGALVTIFSLIGGAVPGTAGQVKIETDTDRYNRMHQRLEDLINEPNSNPEMIKAVETAVNDLRDDLSSERWRQFGIATILYAILGAFFAALLAKDLLQALVIGAGWTAVLGTVGLKNDYDGRKKIKDEQLEKAIFSVKTLEAALKETGKSCEDLNIEPCAVLEKDSRMALKL